MPWPERARQRPQARGPCGPGMTSALREQGRAGGALGPATGFVETPWASLVAQMVKNPPAMQETRIQSLGQEDPLEKGMATHPSVVAWEVPWTEERGGLQSMELQTESEMTE